MVYRSLMGDVAVEARFFREPDENAPLVLGELLLVADPGASITAHTLRGFSVTQAFAAAVLGEPVSDPDLRITRPDGTLDWHEEFARVFLRAAATSTAPAHAIAEASDLPIAAVHRYTYEARRRGLLPKDSRSREPRRRQQ
jgi:hypothetical protein